jgi:membrane-associated phospholipid phosphatase
MGRGVTTDAGRPTASRPLILASIAYLVVASGIMIWRGISVSPDYLLLLMVPIAVASGRFLRFIGDWVPFVALVLGWEAMRGIASASGIPPHVTDIASIETWIFRGHLPTEVLQDWVGDRGWSGAVDYGGTAVYFAHFVLPIAAGMVLWLRDRRLFLMFTTTILAMSLAAFIVYLLLPTAPPWYAQDHNVFSGSFRHVVGNTLPSLLSPYYSNLNPNPTAALPSLHSAFPFLAFLVLRQIYPRAAFLALGWAFVVWFSVVYLGEHYVIDVIAGVTFAVIAWWLMEHVVAPRVAALRPPLQGTAEAVTAAPVALRAPAPAMAAPLLADADAVELAG